MEAILGDGTCFTCYAAVLSPCLWYMCSTIWKVCRGSVGAWEEIGVVEAVADAYSYRRDEHSYDTHDKRY